VSTVAGLSSIASFSLAGWLSLVDQVVLIGIAVVLPLALGGRYWWWVLATAAVLVSFTVPAGWAGVLAAPLLVVTLVVLGRRLEAAGPLMFWRLGDGVEVIACGYAVVAAVSLAQSRTGGELFGIGEPIVELTAVHYMYAGTAALVLARAATTAATGSWQRIARAAVLLTGMAPPVVAAGFVTGAAVPQVGGAVLMSLGVFGTAVLHLREAAARPDRSPLVRLLLAVSGLAVWAPMPLAVAWAASQHVGVPALSIPAMARTHGLAMALGFVVCGLLARRLPVTSSAPTDPTHDRSGESGGSGARQVVL
jgi:YndJ-like protein